MKFHDIRTELENVGPVKKMDIVDLIIYAGQHYCTEIHYWPALEALTVTLYSEQAYKNRILSKFSDMYLVKTIFHLPVEASDIIEAENSPTEPICPF